MSDFKWAFGVKANVKEPLPALQENGWQYADIPTASNFNWLFNGLQKEIESFKIAFAGFKTNLDNLNSELKGIKDRLASEIKNIRVNVTDAQNCADQALKECHVNSNDIETRAKIFYQLCELLKVQEANIRRYHSGFPTHPWPVYGTRLFGGNIVSDISSSENHE